MSMLVLVSLLSTPAISSSLEEPAHDFSLKLSLQHLIEPMVEAGFELRLSDRVGVGLFGGGGFYKSDEGSFKVYDFGVNAVWYAFGSFEHGMQLGAEVMYLALSPRGDRRIEVQGNVEGFGIAPIIGYKVIFDFGLTLELQAGAQLFHVRRYRDPVGADDPTHYVFTNLNAGWSI